jgi:hypothetical protein
LYEEIANFTEIESKQREGEGYIVNQMVNYFAFEARMKDRVLDLIKPVMLKQLKDEEQNKRIAFCFNKLSERLTNMEACFE